MLLRVGAWRSLPGLAGCVRRRPLVEKALAFAVPAPTVVEVLTPLPDNGFGLLGSSERVPGQQLVLQR